MSDPVKSFGETAKGLAHNPLGIIALFLVLVYGMAALVTGFSGSLSPSERTPLVYFLVGFPVLVLVAFVWLVSRHSGKLFAPSDFQDEENYMRTLTVAASLAAANERNAVPEHVDRVVDLVERAAALGWSAPNGDPRRHAVLWVDDHPENNWLERKAFEAAGLHLTCVPSTESALQELDQMAYAAIISDMERREGPAEGLTLLESLRKRGIKTPFFLYSASMTADQRRTAHTYGLQGASNSADLLFEMVTRTIRRTP